MRAFDVWAAGRDLARPPEIRTFVDRFTEPLPPGGVIGTEAAEGVVRRGVDAEATLAVDNGALRIRPLAKPRWGRSGIAYGPYARRNGLAFGAFLVNGHNTSQTGAFIEGIPGRLKRWAKGTETEPPLKRMLRLVRARQRRFVWRRLRQWLRSGSKYLQTKTIDENLAVGWFPSESPYDPLTQGNSLVMHAVGPECGEVWTRHGRGVLRSVRGLQNVQTQYLVVLRERGAAYYASSVPGVPGLAAHPRMRLLSIDPFATDPTVYAGIHQSVLGQIGFRAETRVYAAQVAVLIGYENWYGSAHAADTLTGDGLLADSRAEAGGAWAVWEGAFRRTDEGLVASSDAGETSTAVLTANAPVGLAHVLVKVTDQPVEGVSLIWRARDRDNYWCFEVGSRQCALAVKENGVWSRFPVTRDWRLAPNVVNSIQVSDDGENIRLYLNGETVYGTTLTDTRLGDATGVGLRVAGGNGPAEAATPFTSFEAHPRDVATPAEIDLGEPWWRAGTRVVAADDFAGAAQDLSGRTTPVGGKAWSRDVGRGVFELTGGGAAKVRGCLAEPCPGRTAYTIPWGSPGLADVSVTITPPGTRRGAGERGRGGLICWQDTRNYVTWSVFMDDWYGTSIAAFFHVDGYEELFDAVWTNVGRRIHWGVPYDFRVVFDGDRFLAYVNGEPVLYRAVSDVYPDWRAMATARVGIVANWEYGNDTGSVFANFVARGEP